MSAVHDDVGQMLADVAEDLFARHSGPDLWRAVAPGGWSPELWSIAEPVGLPLVGVPDELGGAGGTLRHMAIGVRLSARHAAPIPLAETAVAGWLLGEAGIDVPSGPLTFARCEPDAQGGFVARRVPYAGAADGVAALLSGGSGPAVALVDAAACEIVPGLNAAGEQRDGLRFGAAALASRREQPASIVRALDARAALVRSVQIAGALEAVRDMTLAYAREREQFGTPIARLPVVRDRLVSLVEETAAAAAAADAAVDHGGILAVAAAKVRCGEAAGRVAALAHQVHGAIGMSDEYPLHHLTRRLWAWRDEEGDERAWAIRLGRELAHAGPDALWPALAD